MRLDGVVVTVRVVPVLVVKVEVDEIVGVEVSLDIIDRAVGEGVVTLEVRVGQRVAKDTCTHRHNPLWKNKIDLGM